jgi:hypothetical protein
VEGVRDEASGEGANAHRVHGLAIDHRERNPEREAELQRSARAGLERGEHRPQRERDTEPLTGH